MNKKWFAQHIVTRQDHIIHGDFRQLPATFDNLAFFPPSLHLNKVAGHLLVTLI